MPATARWSNSALPSSSRSRMRRRRIASSASSSAASRSGPRLRNGSDLRSSASVSSSMTGVASAIAVHALDSMIAVERRGSARGAGAGRRRHEPVMRRWLRSVRPPSNPMSRCLPRASTLTHARPDEARQVGDAAHAGAGAGAGGGDCVPDHRPQPLGRAVNGVAFGHAPILRARNEKWGGGWRLHPTIPQGAEVICAGPAPPSPVAGPAPLPLAASPPRLHVRQRQCAERADEDHRQQLYRHRERLTVGADTERGVRQ